MSVTAVAPQSYSHVSGEGLIYGTIGLIVLSPVLLGAALLYGAYVGVRLAARKLASCTNNEQAERLQNLFASTLRLSELQNQKASLEEFKANGEKSLAQEKHKLKLLSQMARAENPLSGMARKNPLVQEGYKHIEKKRANAKIEEEVSRSIVSMLKEQLKVNAMALKTAREQIVVFDTAKHSLTKLYDEAGPFSKLRENLILWKPLTLEALR